MRVLMISGDKNVTTPGTPAFLRTQLMRREVGALDVVYMGRGSIWPKVPPGQYDVVTSQDPFWRGLFAWRAAKRLKAKLNIQVHADLSEQPFVRHILSQIILRHADSIRVVSEKIKKQVEHIAVKAPISVLPIFVDLSKFSSVVPRPHSSKNILWIGRFEKEKDPLRAIDVLKEVLKVIPDVRLTMLGSGSYGQRVSDSAAHLPVQIPGWGDPVSYLDTADVVLSTSPEESWGASIVEALAAGVPVVAPDVGVAREAGAHIAPRENLAEALLEVLKTGEKGALRLSIPSAQEYATLWRKTLEI